MNSPEPQPQSQQPPKRKRRAAKQTRESAYWDLRAQLSRDSVTAYTQLLAETNDPTTATEQQPIDSSKTSYNNTQNGIVIWTSQEKETLFEVLGKRGKNGVKEIAAAIGTKSELEVQEHLRLLHRGLERQHLRDRHARTVILGEIPAAVEVRGRCGEVLDRYARLLELEEQCLGDVEGRKKHYDMWVIDRGKAEEINEEIGEENEQSGKEGEDGGEQDESEEGHEEAHKFITTDPTIHLIASLFNMRKWVRLSERFFMNPGGHRLEDNWTKIAYCGESPSITADAFADFYALAMSITRRLVQSSLFFATSRVRKMRDAGRGKAKLVKRRDVTTALNVLNMKQDRSDYWIELARRCSLDVLDARQKKGWKAVYMGHNEVEDVLEAAASGSGRKGASQQEPGSQEHTANDDSDSDISEVRSSPEPDEEQLYLSFEDEHAETVDNETDLQEEQRLYQVLGHATPTNPNTDADADANIKHESEAEDNPRRPTGQRKSKEDLVDWRDRTIYRCEWEEYGTDLFDVYDEISNNRRKRRRVVNEPVRFTSPVSGSTLSKPKGSGWEMDVNADVSMDTDDTPEVDARAVKYEGGDGEQDHDGTIATTFTSDLDEIPDQNPVISRHSHGDEDKSETEGYRKSIIPSSQQTTEHEPTQHEGAEDEDEGSGSTSESDTSTARHNPILSARNDRRSYTRGSESMDLGIGSEFDSEDEWGPSIDDLQEQKQIKQEGDEEDDEDKSKEAGYNGSDNDAKPVVAREPKQEREGDDERADEEDANRGRTVSMSVPMSMSPESESE